MDGAQPMPHKHVLIIGGGASGVLMALHLLHKADQPYRVTIIEPRANLGEGIAYSTLDPDHLLNTRVHNMSAFSDDPHHFHHWLERRADTPGVSGQCFVSRATYAAYLAELMTPLSGSDRLRSVRQDCVALEESATGVEITLDDGQRISGDLAVLATGHVQEAQNAQGVISGAWQPHGDIDPYDRVVIIGSGLSMVDQVLSLVASGHRGPILSISRRGQLPRAHATTQPIALNLSDAPLGSPLSTLLAWVRDLADKATRSGGTWRDAIDGIRPHVRSIWRSLPVAEQSRFLRHAATWWDVHRHRMPPSSEQVLIEVIISGQLELMRGAYLGVTRRADGALLTRVRQRNTETEVQIAAARVIDCRGIRRDPAANATPLIAGLLAKGLARVDPLSIGLDVDADCRLLDRDGQPSGRIRVIGPASRAAFWEITAIPDIREQVARLAKTLVPAG